MDLEKPGTVSDIQELLAVRTHIDELLSDASAGNPVTPRADLLDIGDAFRLVLEVPGVAQGNLEIALQGSDLIIAGIREPLETDVEIVFSERPSGHFQRTVSLPGEVDRDSATAHLHDGLLILTLPKS